MEGIAAILGSIAALVGVCGVALHGLVKLLKYCDERRDKQRAEKQSEEMARREEERQRQLEEALQRQLEEKRQRQDNCTHIWEQLTDVNGAGWWLSTLPIRYECHLCNGSYEDVAVIDETNDYYLVENGGDYVAKWHSYFSLPRKGLNRPAPGEPHSRRCECQTCQQQKAAASAYAAAESTGGGYDDVDDLPF